MARLPRFPLVPNVCGVIANVAGAGFYASLSKCARPNSLPSLNKPSWNRASGNIRRLSRLRSTDISISTQSEDADSDAQRQNGDASQPVEIVERDGHASWEVSGWRIAAFAAAAGA